MKLNLGCGEDTREGYINIDIRTTKGINVISNIGALPFKDNSVDEILLLDVIEHFSWRDTEKILREIISKLKIGGTIHVRCPSIEKIIEDKDNIPFERFVSLIYGSQNYSTNYHYTTFTKESLTDLFKKVGLKVSKEVYNNSISKYNIYLKGEK